MLFSGKEMKNVIGSRFYLDNIFRWFLLEYAPYSELFQWKFDVRFLLRTGGELHSSLKGCVSGGSKNDFLKPKKCILDDFLGWLFFYVGK